MVALLGIILWLCLAGAFMLLHHTGQNHEQPERV